MRKHSPGPFHRNNLWRRTMAKANFIPNRRNELAMFTAAATVAATTGATAADDGKLLVLFEEFQKHKRAIDAMTPEMERLHFIWTGELVRLIDADETGETPTTAD